MAERSAPGTTGAQDTEPATDGVQSAHGNHLRSGPGRLLVLLYAIFTVGAASRSLYQLSTRFDEAPLAYLLSALAALVYAFITLALVRGGPTARRVAYGACVAELAGVLLVGGWTVLDPGAFPDATVWSDFGMGYLFIPLALPVTGLLWLRGSRHGGAPVPGRRR